MLRYFRKLLVGKFWLEGTWNTVFSLSIVSKEKAAYHRVQAVRPSVHQYEFESCVGVCQLVRSCQAGQVILLIPSRGSMKYIMGYNTSPTLEN